MGCSETAGVSKLRGVVARCRHELDDSWLHYSSDNKVYAAKNIKKGGLELYPVGFLVKSLSDEKDKGKAIVQHSDSGFKFVVQPPRVELEAGKCCLVPFFWVQPSTGEQQHGAWPNSDWWEGASSFLS